VRFQVPTHTDAVGLGWWLYRQIISATSWTMSSGISPHWAQAENCEGLSRCIL